MPHSVNGIGTHYYGRGNRSEVVGRCENCGRTARLASYDTWECVCVLFVPLVPIGHYRVLNDCGYCRRHRRMKLSEFRRLFDETVVPQRERVKRDPRDAEARRALVDALMGLQMWTEADREARDGVGALPDDPELNRLSGEIAAYRGDHAAATPYLRKAADLAPHKAAVRTRLGQHLLELGQVEDALRELARACALDSSDWQAFYFSSQGLLRLKRWSEALPALERVLALKPEFANDKALVADVARCKRALNYPLSPEEEKASRRRWWWPFGRRRSGGKPGRPVPAWAVLPVLGLAAVVALGVALWRQQHVPVYFDNGLSVRVTVTVGSDTFPLAPQQLLKRSLAPGVAEVVVTGPKGLVERTRVDVARLGLWSALWSSSFYVYNVAERHIYSRWTVRYTASSSVSPPANEPQPQLIALKRFFMVGGVDYAFEKPPKTIRVDSGVHSTRKVAFDVVRELDFASLSAIRVQEGRFAEAEASARKAVEVESCALSARRTLVAVLLAGKKPEAALPEIERWRADCPDAGIELERTYQDAMRQTGREDALRREYEVRLARAPEDAATHYLLGRLSEDPRAGLEHERRAVRIDPKMTWAHVAMAYDLMALERPVEAFDALAAALALPHESRVNLTFAHAAIASGRLDEANAQLGATGRGAPRDPGVLEARWLVAVARRAWPEAASLDAQLAQVAPDDAEAVRRKATMAALQQPAAVETNVAVKPAAPAATSPDAALAAAEIRFCRLAEQQRHDEAVAALDAAYRKLRAQPPPVLQLHAASELLLAGKEELAKQRLARLEETLPAAPRAAETVFLRTAVGVLRGATPPAQMIEAARRAEYLDLDDAYYWAGVRTQREGRVDLARQYWRHGASVSCDFRFPYLAALRLGGPRMTARN